MIPESQCHEVADRLRTLLAEGRYGTAADVLDLMASRIEAEVAMLAADRDRWCESYATTAEELRELKDRLAADEDAVGDDDPTDAIDDVLDRFRDDLGVILKGLVAAP